MIVFTDKQRIPFQIDEEDYEAVKRYTWYINKGYLRTAIGKNPSQRIRRLHVFLLGKAPAGLEWDHINRDKLDNRRANLRAVTKAVNVRNVGLRKDNRSGVIGVRQDSDGRWRASAERDGQRIHLGSFGTKSEAAEARRHLEERDAK